jgi:rhodanese-related sulfurtransferase
LYLYVELNYLLKSHKSKKIGSLTLKNLLKSILVINIFILATAQAQIMSVKQILENVDSQVVKITVDELDGKMKGETDFILLDVRSEKEYLAGHLKNATWLPRGFLEFKIQKLIKDLDSEIVVYCKGGGRSALAACTLLKMGYSRVYNLEGGIREWVCSGNRIFNELGELTVVEFGKKESD